MRYDDQQDRIIMLKIRANLYSLASFYNYRDFKKVNVRPRFHRDNSMAYKPYKLSPDAAQAVRCFLLSEQDEWSDELSRTLKRYHNLKRRSGDLEAALRWEKPTFDQSPGVNYWRSTLRKMA